LILTAVSGELAGWTIRDGRIEPVGLEESAAASQGTGAR
jgi:hypothetical protein